MAMSQAEIERIADYLLQAEADRREVPALAETHAVLEMADAYRVQGVLIGRKESAGDRLVGWKLGLTSRAKQKAMGVFAPVYGALLASNLLSQPEVPYRKLIHPRVEPEIALVLGEDLTGPGITPAQALAAVRWALPALEVIDSRYQSFKFTMPDVVADNASTALALVGTKPVPVEALDLPTLGAVFLKNGQVEATAAGAAVLGDPAVALALLANELGQRGLSLKAGQVILSGALTAATPVEPGDLIEARFASLGSLSLCILDTE